MHCATHSKPVIIEILFLLGKGLLLPLHWNSKILHTNVHQQDLNVFGREDDSREGLECNGSQLISMWKSIGACLLRRCAGNLP